MQVVLLTHYFPPIGGPGTRRMLGWCGGWRDEGVRVVVITPRAEPVDPYYQEHADPIPDGVELINVPIFDPARLARRQSRDDGVVGAKKSKMAGLRRWLLLPDQRRFANARLVAAAASVCGEQESILLTSSPYNSVHLAGLRLKKRFPALYWVADFRDDWFHPVFFPFPNSLYRRANLSWEASVLERADRLVTVNETIQNKVLKRHPKHQSPDRWTLFPNGFDSGLPIPSEPGRQVADGVIDLLYAGTLWPNQSFDSLVLALSELDTTKKFRVEIAGRISGTIPESSQNVEVVISPWRDFDSMMRRMASADFLLVHAGDQKEVMTSKIFECARLGRPVIALGPEDSELLRFVRQQVAVPLCTDPHDLPSVKKLAEAVADGGSAANAFASIPPQYDRRAQARQMLAWVEAKP